MTPTDGDDMASAAGMISAKIAHSEMGPDCILYVPEQTWDMACWPYSGPTFIVVRAAMLRYSRTSDLS